MSTSRTNTIAKNTVFLYMRSFVTMIIGIFTLRVLLATLGIEDYGVYNLVGGLVAMFASLKTVFASAIQRFLNYEKGTGILANVRKVFNLAILVQVCLAIIFFIVVEAIGLWFISYKLNIPDQSVSDAYFIFHFSVLSAVLAIMSSPFDATIIANEKMNVFAWLSMVDSVLRLGIVYLLPLLGFAYVRSYAFFLFAVSVINIAFSLWYCRRFPECKFSLFRDKHLFIRIATFSGWNFLGNTVFSLVNESLNILLNMFGGVAYNASRAVAYQVKNALSVLSANVTVASRPYIVQQSVKNDKQHTYSQICRLSRLVFIVMGMTVAPFIVYTDEIMKIWLIELPIMSTIFVQIILVHLLIRSLHEPIDTLFKAFGDIRNYQIFDSLTLLLSLPLGYIALRCGMTMYSVFIVNSVVEIITLITLLVLLKRQFGLSISYYLKNVVIFCVKSILVFVVIGCLFYIFLRPSYFLQLILYFGAFVLLELAITYFVLLNKFEKQLVSGFINKIIRKKYV